MTYSAQSAIIITVRGGRHSAKSPSLCGDKAEYVELYCNTNEAESQTPKKVADFFIPPIDKPHGTWYNKSVKRREDTAEVRLVGA